VSPSQYSERVDRREMTF